MRRTRTLGAALVASLTLSSLGLAISAPAGADGVTPVTITCNGIPIVSPLTSTVDVNATDSVDPVTVGGSVTNTINVPVPVGDVPIDATITEVTLTIPKPAGVTVTNVTFTASALNPTWSQTGAAVTVKFTGSVSIGPGKPVPTIPTVSVVTTVGGAPRTIQWKVPTSIVAKASWALGNITATCVPNDLNQVLISTTVQAPPNQAPTATDQTVATPFQTPRAITLSGTDPESQPLTFAVATQPANGAVTGTPPNVTYTPDPGFSGQDSFTFTASDGSLSDTGTVTVNVGAAVPVVPGAPTITGTPAVFDRHVDLAWAPPTSDGGAEITGYVITPIRAGVPQAPIQVPASPTSAAIGGLTNGLAHTFTVAAKNSVGTGPASAPSAAVTPRHWLPFASNTDAVNKLHVWLLGRNPTTAERTLWVNRFNAGSHRVADLILALRESSDHTGAVDPVVRLYSAYFLRTPDKPGTVFWIDRRRGGQSLGKISQGFANSLEFKARYGTLTNRQFVELIYQNILGRPGEASGVNFWTAELDARRRDRGQVMIGFSESREYKAKQVDNVGAAVGLILLADKNPTTAERDALAAALKGGPAVTVWSDLLRSPAVVTRATA